MMKQGIVMLLGSAVVLTVALSACGGRRHDAAYYEQMVDSIRKAEQVKEMMQGVTVSADPVAAFFDTLRLHALPILTAGRDYRKLGSFADVPMPANGNFGYPVSSKLKAMALPPDHGHQVVLLAELQDSITPLLYLYTMDKKHQPIDLLCIYEEASEQRRDDYGRTYMEYYVNSHYEITLLQYYQSHHKQRKPELQQTRRYQISGEGLFEEAVIEY